MARQVFSTSQQLTSVQMTQLQNSVWSDDVNAQTGTTYTLLASDAGKQVTMTNASASTLTIPPSATTTFATGVRIQVIQLGAGIVTLTAGSGVTIIQPAVPLTMAQYQVATLTKIAVDTWTVAFSAGGNLTSLIVSGAVTAGSFVGALTGNVTGNVSGSSGSCTGNSATATNVAYTGLTGTVPTWNQNTTGNAATATTASSASNASFATSAGTATNATNATYATTAGSATNATNANYASVAGGLSYVKSGRTTVTTDGFGLFAVGHGLGTLPLGVLCQANGGGTSAYTGAIALYVGSHTSSNFLGSATATNAQISVDWIAWSAAL